MEITIKEAISIIAYVVSIAALFIAFKQKMSSIEKEVRRIMQVLYGSKGALNIVDKNYCKENRDIIFASIRKSDHALQQQLEKLVNMDRNITKIIVYLEIRERENEESGKKIS